MARDEANHVPEVELAHEVEDSSCHHGANRIRDDSRRDHSIRLILANVVGDRFGHVVEEWHDFDLRSC